MDRTAYLCGENVRILAHVENRQNEIVWIAMRLTQVVVLFLKYFNLCRNYPMSNNLSFMEELMKTKKNSLRLNA